MAAHTFDVATKHISRATSRRQLLRGVVALAASLLLERARPAPAQDHQQGTPQVPATPAATGDPGALVRASVNGRVGVLLEDFPEGMRDRIAADVLARPSEWWIERAGQQLSLANYRLIYREGYYEGGRHNLPLPPASLWEITIDPAGPARTMIDGRDLVVVDYQFTSTLLTDAESPGYTEPALAEIGGTWDEEFVFPVDPTLIVQRTGFACMDEFEYPPESVAAESAHEMFDDTCDVEVLGKQFCHFTEPLPTESCVAAITRAVGHGDTAIHFERIAWDPVEADRVRVGELTSLDAPDAMVVADETGLGLNYVKYRYFTDDHCAVGEGCVGGPGWRRLIIFNSRNHNIGGAALFIGEVGETDGGLAAELVDHNVYQFATCHGHYHFQHYGLFTFDAPGAIPNSKNGFCIESTDRLSNNETTPLHSAFNCAYQGMESGWGDLYISSTVCNWVDVTDVDTSGGPVTADLAFAFNPDEFLCEGKLATDASGDLIWEPTEFTTAEGDVVSRPVCEPTPGASDNNLGSAPVTLPVRGGMVSQPCTDAQVLGPLRNCGFEMSEPFLSCTAGETVTVSCTGGNALTPQVVRVCETSRVLGTGVDCSHMDALANVVVEGSDVELDIRCPGPRDANEPGGEVAVYIAPVHASDEMSNVVCSVTTT